MRSVLVLALVVVVSAPVLAAPSVGIIHIQTQSDRSGWLLIEQPLTNADCHDFNGTLDISVQTPVGEPLVAFMSAPDVVWPGGAVMSGEEGLFLQREGGDLTRHFAWREGASGCQAYSFAFASNGNWSVDLRVAFDANGTEAAPQFVSSGMGTRTWHADPAGGPGIARTTLATDLPAGWTHLQASQEWVLGQPLVVQAGARITSMHFPNEWSPFGVPNPPELHDHVLACACTPRFQLGQGLGNYETTRGAQGDIAGHFSADIIAAEDSGGVSLDLVHLPLGPKDFPPGFDRVDYFSFG